MGEDIKINEAQQVKDNLTLLLLSILVTMK